MAYNVIAANQKKRCNWTKIIKTFVLAPHSTVINRQVLLFIFVKAELVLLVISNNTNNDSKSQVFYIQMERKIKTNIFNILIEFNTA